MISIVTKHIRTRCIVDAPALLMVCVLSVIWDLWMKMCAFRSSSVPGARAFRFGRKSTLNILTSVCCLYPR